jgi:predicted short-subunit dehydrogenase-like oxidoreductase (DUF2520 family)
MNDLASLEPVACVGAGRAGTTLLHALTSAGMRVGAIVNRSLESSQRARRIVGQGVAATDLAACAGHPLVIVAAPDLALPGVAERLARAIPDVASPSVALQLSGALAASALAPLGARGFALGSFHPLQTFADPELALRPIAGITFGIEGDAAAITAMRALAGRLEAHVLELNPADKMLYHAAAALAASGLVALSDLATRALAEIGATERAWQALEPLVRGTLDNLASLSPSSALTGPIARGDAETVLGHLRALAERAPRLVAPYVALALAAVDLAERHERIPRERAQELRAVLARPPN